MIENNTKSIAANSLWKNSFNTFRFWAFFLIAFFIGFAETANFDVIADWTSASVSYDTFQRFTYLGIFTAGLISIYFLRTRLKTALILFSFLYLFSLTILRFSPSTQAALYLAAICLKNIGYYGVILTIVATLVTAKLPLKSFLIIFMIIWFCKFLASGMGSAYFVANMDHIGSRSSDPWGEAAPLSMEAFIFHLSCLTSAALAVFTASTAKSKLFYAPLISLKKNDLTLLQKPQATAWSWQDLVSSYRFWGLVMISSFIGFVDAAHSSPSGATIKGVIDNVGIEIYFLIHYSPFLAAALITLYFLTDRIKLALIVFCIIYLIALSITSIMRYDFIIASVPDKAIVALTAQTLTEIARFGIILMSLSALVTARLTLKSFLIAFFIIWFWVYIGKFLGSAYVGIDFHYRPIDDEGNPPFSYVFFQIIVPIIPAAFAILAAILLKPIMFFGSPNISIEAKAASARTPFGVFITALIVPFYFLYWLFKQPEELKNIAPDMHQPSPAGALCMGLFAPMVLPIWFHDVRKGLGVKLKDRSAPRISVAAFFIPAIAAGMAQSDYNQIKEDDVDV